ncbi:hypothetical protein A5848_000542, partial [Enterococcus faecium]
MCIRDSTITHYSILFSTSLTSVSYTHLDVYKRNLFSTSLTLLIE